MTECSRQTVLWKPQPRQVAFMARAEEEALYGGAAGGGKSEALIIEALRQVHIPHYRALILRKTYPELSELIDKSRKYYPPAFPGCKYNETKHAWTFPSGARITFGAMQRETDKHKYQGRAFDFIGFDELTHFTYDQYSYLVSRNRPNGSGTRVYMRATANPGGVGHGWVKDRFITAAPPMTPIIDTVQVVFPDGHSEKREKRRIFVPSTVFDNAALMENDPDYVARLASMPEADREALLYGNWDSFSGQVFTEWRNDPAHYHDRLWTHVIAPFKIPASWKLYRGFDFGYARPFSVGWYAVDHDNRLYRIRELYGCTGEPNVGVKWEPARIAGEIKHIEQDDPNLKGRTIHGIADPAITKAEMGESVAEIMERAGIYFDAGDHQRIAGKMQLHHRLAFDDAGRPQLYIFSTCKHCIRTLPTLVYDSTDVEDIDTEGEDHIYDELRYVAMENPVNPPKVRAAPPKPYSPLDTEQPKYAFFRR